MNPRDPRTPKEPKPCDRGGLHCIPARPGERSADCAFNVDAEFRRSLSVQQAGERYLRLHPDVQKLGTRPEGYSRAERHNRDIKAGEEIIVWGTWKPYQSGVLTAKSLITVLCLEGRWIAPGWSANWRQRVRCTVSPFFVGALGIRIPIGAAWPITQCFLKWMAGLFPYGRQPVH